MLLLHKGTWARAKSDVHFYIKVIAYGFSPDVPEDVPRGFQIVEHFVSCQLFSYTSGVKRMTRRNVRDAKVAVGRLKKILSPFRLVDTYAAPPGV